MKTHSTIGICLVQEQLLGALIDWLWEKTHDPEDVSLNPNVVKDGLCLKIVKHGTVCLLREII